MTTTLWGLGAIVVVMTVLWAVSVRLRDASIVDPAWAPGFSVVGIAYLVTVDAPGTRLYVALGLTAFWGGRLGRHLLARNRAHGEDPRYADMRRGHGDRFWWVSLFTVFWLQSVLLWIVSAPLLGVALAGPTPLGALDGLGVFVAGMGILLEGAADAQLDHFRADPANQGRVLDTGLWRYSRHPNYFGNAVLWWGLYIIAVAAGAAWTVYGPLLMTWLLVRVSGVALLERDIGRRRPEYDAYVRRTSAFIPWFPKEG